MATKKVRIKSSVSTKSVRSGKTVDRKEIVKKNKEKTGTRKRRVSLSSKKGVSKKAASASKKRKILKSVGIVALVVTSILFLIVLSAGIYAFSFLQQLNDELPSPDEPFKNPPVASIIYDRNELNGNGTQLYKIIGNFNSDPVDIEYVPETVTWAFLAAEDIDFYTHSGFDTQGIVRCGFNYVRDGGENVCGASTITQQLLKITALKDETSRYQRKIKELLMSTKVEQSYNKDEILQMYLSVTPFGSNVVGIETASRYYFGKEPSELELHEAAVLSAIIQDPSYLSPTKPIDGDLERAQADVKERQLYVLGQMERYIDQINNQHRDNIGDDDAADILTMEMLNEAKEAELEYQSPVATDIKAGHFVDYVQEQLTTRNYKNGEEPFTLAELQNNGYRIYTSLDYQQQVFAEDAANFGGTQYTYWNVNNASIMTIDPRNGQILAMAGSKNYFGADEGCNPAGLECKFNGQVNTLTSLNEPGSTAKVLAYALAFEQGKLFGGSNLPDIPIDYPEIGYFPKNWDGGYKGHVMSVRDALVQSRNITALQAIELVTVDEYVRKANDLGITTFERNQLGPSVVLGGASVRYTEHINLFGAFANGGNHVPLNPILKIEDRNGNVIYEAGPAKKEQVISEQATFLTNQILDNLQNIGNEAGVKLYSKTGTTENNIEALQVAWNANQVTLAWAGNNNNDPLSPTNGYPIFVVQPWMSSYIRNISSLPYYGGRDPVIAQPGFVYQGGGKCNSNGECLGVASDWLIQDVEPVSRVKSERIMVCADQQNRLARDIDIATGNAIEKEFRYYTMTVERWQDALDKYVTRVDGINGTPKEECNIDRSGGVVGPFFSSMSPGINATVGSSVTVTGGIYTTQGQIVEANAYFDGQLIGSISNVSDVNQSFDISGLGLPNGTYAFRITATDTNGLSNSYEVRVILNNQVNNSITFNLPTSPATYDTGLSVRAVVPFGLNGATLYQSKNGGEFIPLGPMQAVTGGFQYNIGSAIANETAEYRYYIVGAFGNTGEILSNVSSKLNVQKL